MGVGELEEVLYQPSRKGSGKILGGDPWAES